MDQTTSNKPSAKHLVALTQETFFSVFGPSFDPNYPPKLLEATWKKLVYNFGDYITRVRKTLWTKFFFEIKISFLNFKSQTTRKLFLKGLPKIWI